MESYINMTRLIFFVLFFPAQFILAQSYTPFPTKNIIWKQDFTHKYGFTNTNICQTISIEVVKDTLINSLSYHKLKLSTLKFNGDFNRPCTSGIQTFTERTFGYFRNDSINKKVWLRLPNTQSDTLWYDFNYSVGDTLRPTYAILPNQNTSARALIITKIDSILLDNKMRMTYIINDSSCLSLLNPIIGLPYPSQLIEGIGSTNGIITHHYDCNPIISNQLACVQINGQTIYPDSSSCILVTDINELNVKENSILLSPNPSNGRVFINNPKNYKGKIEVFDMSGILLLEFNTIPESITLPNHKNQFLIKIQTENNIIYTHKIILN